MTLFPEVQAKAQEEIDQVVGHDRLPDFRDRENLPYVDAILMETLRWHPVIPLGEWYIDIQDSDIYINHCRASTYYHVRWCIRWDVHSTRCVSRRFILKTLLMQ